MLYRSVVTVIVLVMVWGAAAAQDYYVRTTARKGLSPAPGVGSVEIVPRGTVLHVIGAQGDWLKVNRHGVDLWMTNHPSGRTNFRRVETTPELHAASQAPNIDNCCQIGWDCGTDQKQWEDGYHAYQQAQCGGSEEFDNCCSVGWTCYTYDDWQRGFDAFMYDRTCSAPVPLTQVSSQPVSIGGSVTAGPGDSITVTYPTNLRASFSLQSRVVTTVAAGSTLRVSGREGRWLKVAWSGREIWLAGWVPMSRAEAGQHSPSALVDNCCFVNRQCTTEQEWIDGFWAYQNNQCPAPGQPQSQGLPLRIDGSHLFVNTIRATLDLMKQNAPYYYDYVTSGLDRVVQIQPGLDTWGGIGLGGHAYCSGERVYYSARRDAYYGEYDADLVEEAAVMAHEACHCHRGDVEELPCNEQQMLVAAAIAPDGPNAHIAHGLRMYIRNRIWEAPQLASLLEKPASYYLDFQEPPESSRRRLGA